MFFEKQKILIHKNKHRYRSEKEQSNHLILKDIPYIGVCA